MSGQIPIPLRVRVQPVHQGQSQGSAFVQNRLPPNGFVFSGEVTPRAFLSWAARFATSIPLVRPLDSKTEPAPAAVGERGLTGLPNWEARGQSGPSQPVPAHSLVSPATLLSPCCCQTASPPGPSARPTRTCLPITADAAQAPPSTLTDFYAFLFHH